MTASFLFTVLAATLHLVVLFEVYKFFSSVGYCREADKHIVATTAVGSVAFVVTQTMQVAMWPTWLDPTSSMASLWSGFAVFNAALYYAIAKILTDRRRSTQGFDATDYYLSRKHLNNLPSRHGEST